MNFYFNWKGIILWSNHFYGICSTLLAVEASLYLLNKIPSISILTIIYLVTVFFYTHAYLNETEDGIYEQRSRWYRNNKKIIIASQFFYLILIFYIGVFKLQLIQLLSQASFSIQFLIVFSILIAYSYYRPVKKGSWAIQIRNQGLLKTASIAWSWLMACVFAPVFMINSPSAMNDYVKGPIALYGAQFFIFILILALLFDIKDLNRDKEELVQTIIVKYGIKATIQQLVFPLLLIYLILSLVINYYFHPHPLYVLSQCLILLMVFLVAYHIEKVQSIHYNILCIDGLMIAKAGIGIIYLLAR